VVPGWEWSPRKPDFSKVGCNGFQKNSFLLIVLRRCEPESYSLVDVRTSEGGAVCFLTG